MFRAKVLIQLTQSFNLNSPPQIFDPMIEIDFIRPNCVWTDVSLYLQVFKISFHGHF